MRFLRRSWTAEDDAQLRSLLEAGDSVRLVAVKLRRTTRAVQQRSSKLGIARRHTSREAISYEVRDGRMIPKHRK